MSWIKDYNVICRGKTYKNCVDCNLEVICVDTRFDGLQEDMEEIIKVEIVYLDDRGKIGILKEYGKDVEFVKKVKVVVCQD